MSTSRLRDLLLVYWPVGLAALIMIPRLLSAEFGLFDDGETLRVAQDIQNGDWGVLAKEAIRGRFRPVYWIQYAHIYALFGAAPAWFFLWNTLLFVVVTVELILLVRRTGAGRFQAATTGFIFVLSGPVVENIYTLSKPELLQILLLLGALLFFTPLCESDRPRRRVVSSAVFATLLLLAATLTKETTLVMVPIAAAWMLLAIIGAPRDQRRADANRGGTLLFAAAAASLLYFVLRDQFLEISLSEGTYTNNLEWSLGRLADSIVRWSGWLVRDFVWLAPLVLVLAIGLLDRRLEQARLLAGATVWIAGWILIYLPWEFTVEYYMLPVSIGVSVIAGVALNSLREWIRGGRRVALAWLALGLASALWLTTLPNNLSNARQQIAVDRANARLLQFLSEEAGGNRELIVNIQHENEYVYEVRTHLQDVKGLVETQVAVFDPGGGLPSGSALIAAPYVHNQPLLAVRMGVIEPAQEAWNQSLQEVLGQGAETVFETEENLRLSIVDLPRLLCSVLPERGYCRAERPLIDTREFRYGWRVYDLHG
ncbi:MAG: hypothetical protein ACE5M4_06840 [Anaerolineales bacterium]